MSRAELLVLAGEQAARLAAQNGQITALAAQVAGLMETNEQLAAKLGRLEHLLSRNSGTHHCRRRWMTSRGAGGVAVTVAVSTLDAPPGGAPRQRRVSPR